MMYPQIPMRSNGYYLGGSTASGAYVVTADKLVFSTLTTAAQTSANKPLASGETIAACSSNAAGYYAGGVTGAGVYLNSAYKLTFSSETVAAQTTANLSVARKNGSGAQSTSTGFFIGGSSGVGVSTTDMLTFSTESTAAMTSADTTRSGLGAAASGDSCAFVCGSAINATMEKLTFATNVNAAATTANLSSIRSDLSGAASYAAGYFSGGVTSVSRVATCDKSTFATTTTAAITAANLSVARRALTAAYSYAVAVFSGGSTTSGTTGKQVTSDLTTFSTDTTAAQTSANLSEARLSLCACG